MRRLAIATVAALFLVAASPLPVAAHSRSTSSSDVRLTDDGAEIVLRIRRLDAMSILGRDVVDARIARAVWISTGRGRCEVEDGTFSVTGTPAEPGWLRVRWRVRCGAAPRGVASALPDVIPSHLHIARVRTVDGAVSELALTDREPAVLLSADPAGATAAFVRFVPVGVEHILGGFDHLVFLLMLLLASRSLRETAGVVTGFTVGHSITLALVALGALSVRTGLVEALIGLSILLVAAENLWAAEDRRDRLIPAAVVGAVILLALVTGSLAVAGVGIFAACAFGLSKDTAEKGAGVAVRTMTAALFGLLHGLGFAGALGQAGLPVDAAIPGLLGFNVGVELGQLACVALAWPILAGLRSAGSGPHVLRWGSALGAAAGAFWLVSRL